MKIIPGNVQHIGSRGQQQDAFGFSDLDDSNLVERAGIIAVLADGMGGLSSGAEASKISVNSMLKEHGEASLTLEPRQQLFELMRMANKSVWDWATDQSLVGNTGTTLAAVLVKDQHLNWISVGDSRVYLYRGGSLMQLTRDHNYANYLSQKFGIEKINPEVDEETSNLEALTSFLGLPEIAEYDLNAEPFALEIKDRILICSDGLYRSLSPEVIAAVMPGNPQEACESLLEMALIKDLPGQDNLTVLILACEVENYETSTKPLRANDNRFPLKTVVLVLIAMLAIVFFAYRANLKYNSPLDIISGQIHYSGIFDNRGTQ